ncbi:MAG: hypothetical protein MJA30_30425 [Cytophagales bacterium]|nr:hypothetical protein [Cytophagales bacterium]
MAKRKNPLKDLDSFLNQQASSFVQPERAEDTVPAEEVTPPTGPSTTAQAPLDKAQVIAYLKTLSDTNPVEFRETLYDIIRQSLENGGLQGANDKMLMNTILYLDNPENWKAAISSYWQEM